MLIRHCWYDSMLKQSNSVNTLDQMPVTVLKGVGSHLAEKLNKLGLVSVQDVLFHLPRRYLDRTRITAIADLELHAQAVLDVEVLNCDIVFGKRRSLVCRVSDATGVILLRFFHFTSAQKNRLTKGTRLRVFGEPRRGASGMEMFHPEYDVYDEKEPLALESGLTPVYPMTEGLTQLRMRSLTQQALALLDAHPLHELLSEQKNSRWISLKEALRFLHQPPVEADTQKLLEGKHPLQKRLAFEELLAHHLGLLLLRREAQKEFARQLMPNNDSNKQFLAQLNFSLTQAQQRVLQEIAIDLAKPIPMLRLVQGDVGSGKTLVAAMAMLTAVSNGKQTVLMAPTEILAEQHLRNFVRWFEPLGINIGWLTGKLKVRDRREQLQKMTNGETQIVIGTHALFQDEVDFFDLALVVIDEQHRFGVQQRLSLSEKGKTHRSYRPHQLIMTATPIPRTLTMTAYADLDISIIDELPPGRTPITTVVISERRRDQVIERVRAACEQGRQAYWVCTLIEESETLTAQAAEATAEMLAQALPKLRVGLIHSRLKATEKEKIMSEFKLGSLDLLVATTVIEVGVDVPNASLMIIENPERLGLAQLHQLRGRVGRGQKQSHCVLLYGSELGQHGRKRLEVMRESNDGFFIAEQDLLLRGPGEVLGTRQTGELEFKIAQLERDSDLLDEIKMLAKELIEQQPDVCAALIKRWLSAGERYLQV
jgi:ATP-dependent DNA helicase RecG